MDDFQMMEETIHKDVVDVDQKLAQIVTNVTNQTANVIRQKVRQW